MPTRNYAIRLQAEGGAELRREFEAAGTAGQGAFRSVGDAADQAGAATDRLAQKTTAAAAASRQAQVAGSGGFAGTEAAQGYVPSPGVAQEVDRLRQNANDNGDGSGGFSGGAVASAAQAGFTAARTLAGREGGLGERFTALTTAARGLALPLAGVTAAIVGTATAVGVLAHQANEDRERVEQATRGLGRGTGATASAVEAIAARGAADGKISTGTAREIASGYVATGKIDLSVIDRLTRITADFAKLTGQDIPAAQAELARAFADPARGAEMLADRIGGLDDKTLQLIRTQQEMGDKAAAQKTAFDYLQSTVEANTSATTGLAAAWNYVASTASAAYESLKRAVGVGTGIVPESTQAVIDRLEQRVADRRRRPSDPRGLDPLGLDSETDLEQLTAARQRLQREEAEAKRLAAEARAASASREAGDLIRGTDPAQQQVDALRGKLKTLTDARDDALTRSKLAPRDADNLDATIERYARAVTTLTDADGRVITSAERARQADQLRVDAIKATTEAEKAAVAERQKAFDNAGKLLTPLESGAEISRAGMLARLQAKSKGGGASDTEDDYDRSLKQEDARVRRQREEATTYGQTADVVARYRTETELLAAAKRADRDITPELTAQVRDYADRAGEAAKRVEELREQSRFKDQINSLESEGVKGFLRDLRQGKSAADALSSALDRIIDRLADMTIDSLLKPGKDGGLGGLLSGLFGGGSGTTSSSSGFLAGLKSLFGFASGGFTGFGDRGAVAGYVHGREYVFDAASTERIGVATLESIRKGARGYAGGGYVGDRFTMPSAAAMQPANGSGAPSINFITPPGMQLEADGPPQRRADGSYEQVLKTVENGLAGRASRGRGPFQTAAGGAWARLG